MTTTTTRRIIDVKLKPTAGSRFQPAGFPDIGAALFDRPNSDGSDWEKALVLESAQSMANHLEAEGWDAAKQQPVGALAGLPYVRVLDGGGDFLTASRVESHRLAAAYIKDSTVDGQPMISWMAEHLGLDRNGPVPVGDLARKVMKLDPLAVLHGVFFAESEDVWPGQPRLARAITAFVEAVDVRPAVYGGVRRDEVWQSLPDRPDVGTEKGYKNVIFHRTEYTAKRIEASFVIDVDQLRSYDLGEDTTDLLVTLGEWEIRSLFEGGFRPRTACDLEPVEELRDRSGNPLASKAELEDRISDGVDRTREVLGEHLPLDVTWTPAQAKVKRKRE